MLSTQKVIVELKNIPVRMSKKETIYVSETLLKHLINILGTG
jgi:hypothetical protein